MGVGEWISQNWFNLFSSAGIIGGLWFTAVSLRSETKTRRIANLLTITANYREVWKEFFHSPELARVIEPSADVKKQPVTPAERFFVNMVISHTGSMYEALKDELVTQQEGLRRDVGSFLSLPIPQAVWKTVKIFQNADFVKFVEKCRRGAFVLRMLARILGFARKKSLPRHASQRQYATVCCKCQVSVRFCLTKLIFTSLAGYKSMNE